MPLFASMAGEGRTSFVSIHSPKNVEQALCPACKSASPESSEASKVFWGCSSPMPEGEGALDANGKLHEVQKSPTLALIA